MAGDDWVTPEAAPPGREVSQTALSGGVANLADEVHTLNESVRSDRRIRRALVAISLAVGVGYGILWFQSRATSADTHHAVRSEIPALQHQVADRDHQIADLNDVNDQAVAQIIRLAKLAQAHGIDPGQIVLKPTTTTTTAPGH